MASLVFATFACVSSGFASCCYVVFAVCVGKSDMLVQFRLIEGNEFHSHSSAPALHLTLVLMHSKAIGKGARYSKWGVVSKTVSKVKGVNT